MPVRQFVEATRKYLATVDDLTSQTRCDFLATCARLLPRLYELGQALPEVDPGEFSVDLPHIESRMAVIGKLLGDADEYAQVFDPIADRKFLMAYLSDDLSDIYSDLAGPLRLYDNGPEAVQAEAIWHWRFNITGHCGDHIVSALRPIHRLLYDHLCPEGDLERE